MRHRVILATATLGAVMWFAGCHAEMEVQPPSAVAQAFQRDNPGATQTKVEKESNNGQTRYEYKYTDSNGNRKTVEYDSSGNKL